MINKFETIIGIEIHLELNTKTKCFSSVANKFNQSPNQLISPIDLAYPGTLPLLNQAVVIKAIQLAKALNMEIDHELHFDRKHYFYPDLPKSYQITQEFRPIGKNGFLEIEIDSIIKKIEIERIHIEEDTAKLIHQNQSTLINYNRAGVPLIEIVTKPQINNANEATKYIETISQITKFLNISDAIMAKGSLRADINISTRQKGAQSYGRRVEIKNLNSLNNIKKAIEFESQLQIEKLLKHQVIKQETKRFDEQTNQTITIRTKSDAIDYKYFPEPNIPVIKLDSDLIQSISTPMLPNQIKKFLTSYHIDQHLIKQIMTNPSYWNFLNTTNHPDWKLMIKIFFADLIPIIKNHLLIQPNHFYQLIEALKSKTIAHHQLKQIVPQIVGLKTDIKQLLARLQSKQINDPKNINQWIEQIKNQNPSLVNNYQTNPNATTKFVIGQIMKLSKGQADPILSAKLVKQALS